MFCNLTLLYCNKGEHVRNSNIIYVKTAPCSSGAKLSAGTGTTEDETVLHQGIELKEECELNYCIFLLRMLNDWSGIL